MSRMRGKLTYANVMATIAVFIALGGAGYAAVKLPKGSVGARQLKRGAVTPAKLSPAAKPRRGPVGPAGATGPPGPKGEPGPAVSVLSGGKSESGAWGTAGAMGNFMVEAIDFSPDLPGPVPATNTHFLTEGTTTAVCPGPGRSAPGQLCFYGQFEADTAFVEFESPTGAGAGIADPSGVVLILRPTASSGFARGSWTYTAP
jgi:hypothetical protein